MSVITDLYIRLFGKGAIQDGNVIDMAEHGRTSGISTGQGYKNVNDVEFAQKVTVSGSVTYVGIAKPGTAQSDPLWQAKKIDQTTGTVITWADGDANFDNVVTDLTALSYS